MIMPILKYRKRVFLAIRLLSAEGMLDGWYRFEQPGWMRAELKSVLGGDEAEGVAEFFGGGGGEVEVLPVSGEVEGTDAVGKVQQEVAVGVVDRVA